jgi:uncharacterized protein (UPF0303 family)
MFGWGFLTATILWIALIQWRTHLFSELVKGTWQSFKDWVKRKVNNW